MRQHPRLDVDRPCNVELPGHRTMGARLLNVSMGGVGLETVKPMADDGPFTLILVHGGAELRLPCEVRHLRDVWSRQMIHAEFARLSPEEYLAVERFIEDIVVEQNLPSPRSLWRRMRERIGGARPAVL